MYRSLLGPSSLVSVLLLAASCGEEASCPPGYTMLEGNRCLFVGDGGLPTEQPTPSQRPTATAGPSETPTVSPSPTPSAPPATPTGTPTPTPDDPTPPVVTFVRPDRDFIGAEVELSAGATDSGGLVGVEFGVRDVSFGAVDFPPYRLMADFSGFPEGPITVWARARDRAGNVGERTRDYTLDRTAPVATTTFPADGATVPFQPIEWTVTASDEASGVAQVEFRVDGQTIGIADEAPYGAFVDWREYSSGQTLRLQAVVTDGAGNTDFTPNVMVTFE